MNSEGIISDDVYRNLQNGRNGICNECRDFGKLPCFQLGQPADCLVSFWLPSAHVLSWGDCTLPVLFIYLFIPPSNGRFSYLQECCCSSSRLRLRREPIPTPGGTDSPKCGRHRESKPGFLAPRNDRTTYATRAADFLPPPAPAYSKVGKLYPALFYPPPACVPGGAAGRLPVPGPVTDSRQSASCAAGVCRHPGTSGVSC